MTLKFNVVIPARYGSTRLPGKPLLMLAGKPMIVHVCERAHSAGAEHVIVATDDERIFNAVVAKGFSAMMTHVAHQSGTERIAEVARQCHWQPEAIIVNLQGDEPLIPVEYIREVAIALATQQAAGIATLAAKINDIAEIFNPNAVKVVVNKDQYALYFSRAPIPWDRSTFTLAGCQSAPAMPYLRHIGIYAYRVAFLQRYCAWSSSVLENIEALEQLRILWEGESIFIKTVAHTPPAGIDTLEDLHRVAKILSKTDQINLVSF